MKFKIIGVQAQNTSPNARLKKGLLDLLLGLQRKSNDCEKEYYKNKT